MKIPDQITLIESFYLSDGGTIVLIGEEPNTTRHQITLYQSLLLNEIDPNKLPGRLYFNQLIIPVRSKMEADIIRLLQASKIVEEPTTPSTAKTAFNDGPGMIIGDDLKGYYAKLTEGKSAVIRYLRDLMLSRVQSQEYLQLAQLLDKKK